METAAPPSLLGPLIGVLGAALIATIGAVWRLSATVATLQTKLDTAAKQADHAATKESVEALREIFVDKLAAVQADLRAHVAERMNKLS